VRPSEDNNDSLPCRHSFPAHNIERAKELLLNLDDRAPEALVDAGLEPGEWPVLLRAAVESLRGTSAATTGDKRRFIEAVLAHGAQAGVFGSWSFIGTEGRNDYRVDLPDGTAVCIEAKGCPDGNNTTIWDRPGWAREFVVWCQCPESLAHDPGRGAWSGVATRLLPKAAAERTVVDAMIFWDGRCGSRLRRCPKEFGVVGGLRTAATDIPAQEGRDDWLPPPCIYLLPQSYPRVANNPSPPIHTVSTLRFADALMELFNVPPAMRSGYVHEGRIAARNVSTGTQIQVTVVSKTWPDGEDRQIVGRWKSLRRE
jgi:hypothetical protein